MKTTDRKNSGLSRVTDVATRSAYSYYSGVMQEDGDSRKDVRGIRRVFAAALLSGVSMLAVGSLSTSGAQAGTCLPAATPGGVVYCLGTFSETIDIIDVEDLTIVVDDAATIDTSGNTSEANGDNIGVLMTDDFDQTVNNYGTILTSDADVESTYTGHHGIAVYSGYAEAVIRNKAGAFVGTVNDSSYGLFAFGGGSEGDNGSAVVINAGTVVTEGDGSKATVAIGEASARVENSGSIETTGSGGYGMFSVAGEDDGTATATNFGDIQVSGTESAGAVAQGKYATATNTLSGTIEVTGSEGVGLSADGFWSATVQNAGEIDISGADSVGASVEGKYAYATNTGTITVTGDDSLGIGADGKYTTVYNSGSINVGSEEGEDSFGIRAFGRDTVTITNTASGSVNLDSYAYDASRIAAVYAFGDEVTFNNYGLVQTGENSEDADAVVLVGEQTITVNNTGRIYSNGYDGDALIVGGEDLGDTTIVDITNGEDGVIAASNEYGSGIVAQNFGSFTLNNSGDISVADVFDENVFAISAVNGEDASIYNHGNITGRTFVDVDNYALFVNHEDGVVYNAGQNDAVDLNGDERATFVNYGSVTATDDGASAANVISAEGNAYALNVGTVTTSGEDATAIYVYGEYSAVAVNALTGVVVTNEDGSDGISVYSEYGVSQVVNVGAVTTYGDDSFGIVAGGEDNEGEDSNIGLSAGNAGDINTYGEGSHGVVAYSLEDTATAYNVLGGTVTTRGDGAIGVLAVTGAGRDDFGDVTESSYVGENAYAVNGAFSFYGFDEAGEDTPRVLITDFMGEDFEDFSGEDIDFTGLRSYVTTSGDYAHGVAALANGDDEYSVDASAINFYGTIVTGDAEGEDGVGSVGVFAYANYGDAWVSNKYVSAVTTYGDEAAGLKAIALYGDATASNKYNSTIETFGDNSDGIFVQTIGSSVEEGATAYNVGSSITTHGDNSAGIYVYSVGDARVRNADARGPGEDSVIGTIITSGANADGIYVSASESIFIYNEGTITTSGADSDGIVAYGGGSEFDNIDIGNYGSITVTGSGADGIIASGYDVEIRNKYDASISSTNGLAIHVFESDNAEIVNAGSITGNSDVDVDFDIAFENKYAGTITSTQDGILINLDSDEGNIDFLNAGSITQTGGSTAINSTATIRIDAAYNAEFTNNGTISSNNYAYYGDGFVVDIDADNADVDNTGSIIASGGMFGALNVFANEDIYATNGEDGVISSSADEGFAVRLRSGDHAQLDNFGSISTSGDNSTTVIVSSQAIFSSVVNNYGTISATGYYSDAVSLDGRTISLTNAEGALIEATKYGDAVVADAFAFDEYSASVSIQNDGTITGDVLARAYSELNSAYVYFQNSGTVTGDVALSADDDEGSSTIYALNTGSITGNLSTSGGNSDDTIVIDGGTIGGGLYTGYGEDTVTISGAGVSITNGIHSFEGNSSITFAQDDTVTFDVGNEGYAISGASSIDFESGTTVFDSLDIDMEEGSIVIGEDATVVATGTGFYASGADETEIFGTLQVASGAEATFSGDVSFNSGSTFHTGVTSGVGGVVNGDTISFSSESTIYADLTVNQDIVVGDDVLIASASTENGVSDEGAAVVDNSILFNFSKVMNGAVVTSGSADELFLRLETDETAIDTSVNSNGSLNLDRIANALDEYIRTQPISNPLVQYLNQFGTPEEQRAALLQVLKDTMPEESEGSGGAVFSSTDIVFDMIMDRLSGGGFTIAEGSKTGMAAGEQLLGGEGKWAIWGRFGGSKAEYTPSGINGFDADSWGGTIGVDGEIAPNLRLGLSYFYTSSTVDENGTAPNSSLDVTGNGAVAYLSYRPASWYVNGSVGYSINEFDSSRRSIGGVNVASYDGDQFVLRGEVGKIFNSGAWEFTPNVGLRYNLLQIDSYTETGPLPISVAGRDVESLRGTLGVNARYVAELDGGSKLIPEFGVKLINELADPDGTITGSVVGGGAFSTSQTPRDDLSFGLGAGLTFEGTNGVSVRVTYDGEYQSDYKEHTLGAAVRVAF